MRCRLDRYFGVEPYFWQDMQKHEMAVSRLLLII